MSTIVVRTEGEPTALTSALRKQVWAVDPKLLAQFAWNLTKPQTPQCLVDSCGGCWSNWRWLSSANMPDLRT